LCGGGGGCGPRRQIGHPHFQAHQANGCVVLGIQSQAVIGVIPSLNGPGFAIRIVDHIIFPVPEPIQDFQNIASPERIPIVPPFDIQLASLGLEDIVRHRGIVLAGGQGLPEDILAIL
jgi:hypothetical protein